MEWKDWCIQFSVFLLTLGTVPGDFLQLCNNFTDITCNHVTGYPDSVSKLRTFTDTTYTKEALN